MDFDNFLFVYKPVTCETSVKRCIFIHTYFCTQSMLKTFGKFLIYKKKHDDRNYSMHCNMD